jgi:hypothetical protein
LGREMTLHLPTRGGVAAQDRESEGSAQIQVA